MGAGLVSGRNSDYSWSHFDSEVYFKRNYAHLRHDDREILTKIGSYLAKELHELPPDSWRGIDVGTGVDRFLTALAPGAPFVIAFMEHRTRGYHVGAEPFPSTDIGVSDVVDYLKDRVELKEPEPVHIGVGNEPLDDPYTGMIVAYGRV